MDLYRKQMSKKVNSTNSPRDEKITQLKSSIKIGISSIMNARAR